MRSRQQCPSTPHECEGLWLCHDLPERLNPTPAPVLHTLRDRLDEASADPGVRAVVLVKVFLGRHATAEDIAPAIVVLAARDSRWINGTTITADGGISGAVLAGLVPPRRSEPTHPREPTGPDPVAGPGRLVSDYPRTRAGPRARHAPHPRAGRGLARGVATFLERRYPASGVPAQAFAPPRRRAPGRRRSRSARPRRRTPR